MSRAPASLLSRAALFLIATLVLAGCRSAGAPVAPRTGESSAAVESEFGRSIDLGVHSRSSRSDRGKTRKGPKVRVGNGSAWTYVEVGRHGRPRELGVILTRRALEGLPKSGPEIEYVLRFPRRVAVPPFTHVGLNFNPEGHPPPDIYGVPHFDFHFYTITEKERAAIDGSSGGMDPPAQFIPRDYVSTIDVVPQMGVHWVDPTSPEFQPGGRFTRTMIYGFFDGVMAFVEPMVTLEFLKNDRRTSEPVKQPAEFQRAGYYPTRYSIQHDRKRGRVVVALTDLVRQRGALKARDDIADNRP